MEDDLDATVIKNTQLSLGKYVKRPPLSDKLLRKPPFRFLHDIVTSVLKSKGFFDGLFEETELISENVKDRESKISFLNKVIAVVSLTTGKTLTVKPTKIVAGQEAAKTNELLQCIAQALDDNLSSDEAVKQFKSGAKITANNDMKNKESAKVIKNNVESKKLSSKSSEKLIASEKDRLKTKTKDGLIHKKESPPKKSISKTSNRKQSDKSNQEGKKNIASEQKNVLVKQKTVDNFSKHKRPEPELNEGTDSIDKNLISVQSESLQKDTSNVERSRIEEQLALDDKESNLKPTSANTTLRTNEDNNEFKITTEQDVTSSHSLGSDKGESEHTNHGIKVQSIHQLSIEEIKDQSTHNNLNTTNSEVYHAESKESDRSTITDNVDKKELNISSVIRPSSVRPSSSRPGAPRVRDKIDNVLNDAGNIIVGKVNIISENTLHEEEEDTSVIIETNSIEELQLDQNLGNNNLVNQNSHLVQQILYSQREYSQLSGKTEIEWQFGAQKAPDIFVQEIEQLKFNVQALSRIANPLGKLLDHIQEDVEVMRQELQQWTQLYDETSKELLIQKNSNNEALLPFHAKLKQLTSDMEEKRDKITDIKMSIHKNNSRIEKLLINNNVQ